MIWDMNICLCPRCSEQQQSVKVRIMLINDLEIAPATAADIPTLHHLIESAYRGESAKRGWTHEADLLDGQRTDSSELSAIFADERQVMLAVRKMTDIIGCVNLTRLNNDVAYLGMLTVTPAIQAGGVGKQLIAASEDYVQEKWHIKTIEMTVIRQRTELIAWYKRQGYRQTGETRPFPLDDPRFGLPKTCELEFTVLSKML